MILRFAVIIDLLSLINVSLYIERPEWRWIFYSTWLKSTELCLFLSRRKAARACTVTLYQSKVATPGVFKNPAYSSRALLWLVVGCRVIGYWRFTSLAESSSSIVTRSMQSRSTEGCSKLKFRKCDKFRREWSRHENKRLEKQEEIWLSSMTKSVLVQSHLQIHRWLIVNKQPRLRKLSGSDVSCWTWDKKTPQISSLLLFI